MLCCELVVSGEDHFSRAAVGQVGPAPGPLEPLDHVTGVHANCTIVSTSEVQLAHFFDQRECAAHFSHVRGADMNIFTLIGDILHLASVFILILKIYSAKNCRGKLVVLRLLVKCLSFSSSSPPPPLSFFGICLFLSLLYLDFFFGVSRCLAQDSNPLLHRFRHAIYGPLLQLRFHVQLGHEGHLYWLLLQHRLPYALQETDMPHVRQKH